MASKNIELDSPGEDNGSVPGLMENGLVLRLVADGESGEGFPYAPTDWPNPGDTWRWKVGKRKYGTGFMSDRYLSPPSHLLKPGQPKPKFASMQAVKRYILKEFPNGDIDAFFASFSWRIPSKDHNWGKDRLALSSIHPKEETAEHSGSESNFLTMDCKARNRMCSVQREARNCSLPDMDCDICCGEAGFCRNCCCILCSRTIDWVYGGYSFVRCEAKQGENYVCGHAAHVDCALRSYMAGTVGGSIGLDVEYYCRRCDQRTDLISHVSRLLQTCESLDSRDDIEKILKVGLCILCGSQRVTAKNLLNCIELALRKLRSGIYLEEIWNMEGNISVGSAGAMPHLGNNGTFTENMEVTDGPYPLNFDAPHEQNVQKRSQEPVYITSDYCIESLKLENEIDRVLHELKKSQEVEYRIAEERLYAKKNFLLSLYQQLDTERSELAKRSPSSKNCDIDAHLTNVLNKVNQIKQEVIKLKDMEQISRGYGRTPTGILKEHFGLQFGD
ncbi:hypothetical protein BVC80_441g210 [Macleaya cordata]|uniref:Uncharacterized protein n=1 Tax=Macleaya cordata TaxID=56857 RepID=A0A200Q4T4_MACCD|nr:hypothetical protein BVC80_441g210 [Macleaya cordata]